MLIHNKKIIDIYDEIVCDLAPDVALQATCIIAWLSTTKQYIHVG
jgi:hypothetical protein